MFALTHKKTGEVQFVHSKAGHDLTEWSATTLSEVPTEFHRFENGKLVFDQARSDKAKRVSAIKNKDEALLEMQDRIATLEQRLDKLELK